MMGYMMVEQGILIFAFTLSLGLRTRKFDLLMYYRILCGFIALNPGSLVALRASVSRGRDENIKSPQIGAVIGFTSMQIVLQASLIRLLKYGEYYRTLLS